MDEDHILSVACITGISLCYSSLAACPGMATDAQSNLTGGRPPWWEAEAVQMTAVAVKRRWGLTPEAIGRVLKQLGEQIQSARSGDWSHLSTFKSCKYIAHTLEYLVHGMKLL